MAVYIFTCGDINGIGPEIAYKTLKRVSLKSRDSFIFIVPDQVLNKLNKMFGGITTRKFDMHGVLPPGVSLFNPGKIKPGKSLPSPEAGEISFAALEYSFALLKEGIGDAVITAPISKTSISLAGINFPGQTEMFARWSGTDKYVMTFLSNRMNAALHTIHIPLKDVPAAITNRKLQVTISVVDNMLRTDLGCSDPKIAILGLNPHAGENGIIGKEEIKTVAPLIQSLQDKFNIRGPLSPDAFFARRLNKDFDMVIGMYHDQVLIPFKQLNFDRGVNFTAGLPVVRTSPDHGTAFDIAWKGTANESSMIEAFRYAKKIVQNRRKYDRG